MISSKVAADRLGVSERRIRQLAAAGRIKGAVKLSGNAWLMPVNRNGDVTVKPIPLGRPVKGKVRE
jgi:hypothetical protein